MINILYIHGFQSNGNSRTSTLLKQYIGNGFNIISPDIPFEPHIAISFIKNIINTKKIDVVIASSLGGFYALHLRNVTKILINPCVYPAIELPKISTTAISTKILDVYMLLSQQLWNNIDNEERGITYGIFSTNDKLFSYQAEYQKHYHNIIKVNDQHRLSPNNIKNVLVPLVHKIIINDAPKMKKMLGESQVMEFSTSIINQLNEKYVNAFTNDEMYKYAEEVWNILQMSYAPIGGLFGVNTIDELIKDSDMWKMVRKNGKIVAVKIYSMKRGGRKAIAGGTDGTDIGKQGLYDIIKEDVNMKDRNAWSEVSGKMEHIMLKNGAIPIPSKIAAEIMSDKKFISFDPDGYHYTRKIGNIEVRKLLVGNY